MSRSDRRGSPRWRGAPRKPQKATPRRSAAPQPAPPRRSAVSPSGASRHLPPNRGEDYCCASGAPRFAGRRGASVRDATKSNASLIRDAPKTQASLSPQTPNAPREQPLFVPLGGRCRVATEGGPRVGEALRRSRKKQRLADTQRPPPALRATSPRIGGRTTVALAGRLGSRAGGAPRFATRRKATPR